MPRLFLATVELRTTHYMEDNGAPQRLLRLVWAASSEEAEALIRQTFTKDDPYGTSTEVICVETYEALGTAPM
jgi:hypothetical protein